MNPAAIRSLAEDADLLEAGRRAVEDVLIDYRDSRLSMPFRGNGMVVREKDGQASSIIRLGTEDVLRIALKAIADRMEAG